MVSVTTEFVAGNAKYIREINAETILRIIRERQPISRVQISKLTGLSKPTVSSIITSLIRDDLVYESISKDGIVGRNPINLSLKLGRHLVGALDIDSPISRVGIADIDGSIKKMSSIRIDSGSPDISVAACVEELNNLCDSLNISDLEAVGCSVTGIVDSKKLIVNYAPNLGWEKFNLGEEVRKLLPKIKSVSIGNGGNLSALAESWFGTHNVDLTNFVFLSVTSGVGSGIIIDKKLLEGVYQAAGEFGHMVIYEDGEACLCGKNGCLEAYASNRATVNRYIVKKYGTDNPVINVTMEDVMNFAKQGDTLAIETLREAGHYLGLGLSNIIEAIDPQVIIIGGKIIQAWDFIYPEIMRVVVKRAYFGRTKSVDILPTSLTTPPRLLGAATLAIKEIFNIYIANN
jgi:predicted NBD/HSP70 family sugar kinase